MDKLLGLPPLASQHGRDVDNLIIYIHYLMIALFVGWLAYFAYALFRFHRSNNPRADYLGVKSHASSYVEVAVAVVEGFLLIGFAVPLWAKAVDDFPADKDSTVVHIVAQQFGWNARYAGVDGIFGKQDMHFVANDNIFGVDPADPNGTDDVPVYNDIHVPLTRLPNGQFKPVIMYISSKDVIHSFKLIAMRVTQDAIPGLRIPIHFTPTQEGRFQINCAQLCGNGHYSMSQGYLVVDSEEAFNEWLSTRSGPAQSLE